MTTSVQAVLYISLRKGSPETWSLLFKEFSLVNLIKDQAIMDSFCAFLGLSSLLGRMGDSVSLLCSYRWSEEKWGVTKTAVR